MGLSRIGKKPIPIPQGVKVTAQEGNITIRSADGKNELSQDLEMVLVEVTDKEIILRPQDDSKTAKARHGLYRSLLANMVEGVSNGFQRRLEIVGVGYKAEQVGPDVKLTIGFSQPVVFSAPAGITLEVPAAGAVLVKGIDKQLVGETAARIRRIRPPEPYKGKGIRYSDEIVKKKAVKGK